MEKLMLTVRLAELYLSVLLVARCTKLIFNEHWSYKMIKIMRKENALKMSGAASLSVSYLVRYLNLVPFWQRFFRAIILQHITLHHFFLLNYSCNDMTRAISRVTLPCRGHKCLHASFVAHNLCPISFLIQLPVE